MENQTRHWRPPPLAEIGEAEQPVSLIGYPKLGLLDQEVAREWFTAHPETIPSQVNAPNRREWFLSGAGDCGPGGLIVEWLETASWEVASAQGPSAYISRRNLPGPAASGRLWPLLPRQARDFTNTP
jgi:hypothetical protein